VRALLLAICLASVACAAGGEYAGTAHSHHETDDAGCPQAHTDAWTFHRLDPLSADDRAEMFSWGIVPGEYISRDNVRVPYRLHVPPGWDADRWYPLILHLHGAGGRGVDNGGQVMDAGGYTWIRPDFQAAYPSFVLYPQVPQSDQWVNVPFNAGSYSTSDVPESRYMRATMEFVETVLLRTYRVNHRQMYITGTSMGGYGVYDALVRYPTTFAAGLVIAGCGDYARAQRMRNIGVRAFHGSDDAVVPVQCARDMDWTMSIQYGAPDWLYTEYAGAGHGVWFETLENQANWDWLMTRRRP